MFTRDQIEEIKKKLIMLGTKDTQFPDAHKLNGEEIIAIVQDGENKKIPLSSIINDDFINVSKDTTEILTLSTAVSKIDINNRKLGQVITFKDSANSWAIRQFTGSSLDNWNDISLWKSISGIDELKSQVETNAENISVLSDEIERHDASILNLGTDVSKLKDKDIETSSSLSELTTRVDTIKSQADTNTSNISSLNTEVSALHSKVDENTESIKAKITTDRIEDGAVTTEKIATSAFDDTLSVSDKIAPADVVGGKLSELESETNTRLSELEGNMIEVRSGVIIPDFIFYHISSTGFIGNNGNRNICFKSPILLRKGTIISVDRGYKYQIAVYDVDGIFVERKTWETSKTILDQDRIVRIEVSDLTESVLTDTSISKALHLTALEFDNNLIQVNLSTGHVIVEGAVGSIVSNLETIFNIYRFSSIVDVKEGDVYLINAIAEANRPSYAILSADNTILVKSEVEAKNKKITIPANASKLVLNSRTPKPSYKYSTALIALEKAQSDSSFDTRITKNTADIAENTINIEKNKSSISSLVNQQESEIRTLLSQGNNIVNALGIDTFKNKEFAVSALYKYSAWPFVGVVNDRLVCAYTEAPSHEHVSSLVRSAISDNGVVWSGNVVVSDIKGVREGFTGKGVNDLGELLLIKRVGALGSDLTYFEIIKTTDGIHYETISEIHDDKCAGGHIGDIVNIPNVGLFAFFNKYGSTRSWGYIKSTDNGVTWQAVIVESGLSLNDCPVEMSPIFIGNSKILVMGRRDTFGTYSSMIQLQSSDNGVTWQRYNTNIDNMVGNTPSILLSGSTIDIYTVERHGTTSYLKHASTSVNTVWDNPTSWPTLEKLHDISCQLGQDCGNVNATKYKGCHILAYYTGKNAETGIYVYVK